MGDSIFINTDGGARGNPGPAACAFVVSDGKNTIFEGSSFLGTSTNNRAEYEGVLTALVYLSQNKQKFAGKNIIFVLDSELVAKQLSGIYKTKDIVLKALLLKAKSTEKRINNKIVYTVVSREQNKSPDFLVNEKLDEILNSK